MHDNTRDAILLDLINDLILKMCGNLLNILHAMDVLNSNSDIVLSELEQHSKKLTEPFPELDTVISARAKLQKEFEEATTKLTNSYKIWDETAATLVRPIVSSPKQESDDAK